MAKMGEQELLSVLQAEADAAMRYSGQEQARTQAMRDYLRMPYGTEEDGRSDVVASDVFDAVEGMLPDLLEVFVGSDEAVRFDPVGPEDEEGADQASAACNYVFYKQNNGFLILYSAIKDGLMFKTGGIKWCWEERRTPNFQTLRGPEMQIAMHLMTNPGAEVVGQEDGEPMGMPDGSQIPTKVVKVKTIERKGKVRLFSVPSDELRVSRQHDSILLDDCAYVAHVTRKTYGDMIDLGFDVTEDDIKAADNEETPSDAELRSILRDGTGDVTVDRTDTAATSGWLREEYVLVDFDGDGIAERRRIFRLGDKILENKEVSHVQIAAWTPYILTHQFEGLSLAELVSDFQRLQTEVFRQSWDSLQLANNNESVVLTDSSGAPMANIDDLLNRRPGGVIRERSPGAVRPYNERWKGMDSAPMVEMMHSAKENRTGWTRYSQGLDGDSLNKTATGVRMLTDASQKRMKLMSRVVAEALVCPVMRGIFKTLTDYCMEKLSFRLNGKYVQYDPQEWRDQYDMTVNVGIGSGDKMMQQQMLAGIEAAQMAAVQGGGMGLLVTPRNIYNLQKRKVELSGFKDAGEFWTEPPEQMQPQEPKPDPKAQFEGAKLQADQQKFVATQQNDVQRFAAQQQADQQKFAAEAQIKATEAERERAWKAAEADKDRQLQMILHNASQQEEAEPEEAILPQVAGMLESVTQVISQRIDMSKPEKVEKLRDKSGRMIGARITSADGSVRDVSVQ